LSPFFWEIPGAPSGPVSKFFEDRGERAGAALGSASGSTAGATASNQGATGTLRRPRAPWNGGGYGGLAWENVEKSMGNM